MKRAAALAFLAGLLFGAGLVISGMAMPQRVLAFLTLGPGWDPALVGTMGGALAVALPGFWLARRRGAPLAGGSFAAPGRSDIDRRLIGGAALFGLGWGLSGYCPGPVIVSAGLGKASAWIALAAMLAGGALVRRFMPAP
ncbi:hypothetical protein C3942_07620 [Solimonas fluminis]|uniref:YeeE/YedE family protein n=1 Tax=Solimonas fluminis TaxID=2086571 RepID=A0A2S5TI42_9GAMM|nr:DUF6691 family protein [Solimonas fluminis]PPE74622.1 hypothetical protein C3942_07620 [Solimonas fluminis]